MGNRQSKPTADNSTGDYVVNVPRPKPDFSLADLDDMLIQPPDDASLKRSWCMLSSLISSHANNFYHDESISTTREMFTQSVKTWKMASSEDDADQVARLLRSRRSRNFGVRICIARAVLSSIDFAGDPNMTSLDREIVSLMARFKTPGVVTPGLHQSSASEAALPYWRMVTALLLPQEKKLVPSGELPVTHHLMKMLEPFSRDLDSKDMAKDRRDSLENIARQAKTFGEKLFCHPGLWRFEWHSPQSPNQREHRAPENGKGPMRLPSFQTKPLVLFPALVLEGSRLAHSAPIVVAKADMVVLAGGDTASPLPSPRQERRAPEGLERVPSTQNNDTTQRKRSKSRTWPVHGPSPVNDLTRPPLRNRDDHGSRSSTRSTGHGRHSYVDADYEPSTRSKSSRSRRGEAETEHRLRRTA